MEEVSAGLEWSSEIPPLELGILDLSAATATTLLNLKQFKTVVVQELQPCDPAKSMKFCNWIFQCVVYFLMVLDFSYALSCIQRTAGVKFAWSKAGTWP